MSRENAELGAFVTGRPRWGALRFVASSGEPVRQTGDERPVRVVADGFDLTAYRRNPVLLWRHGSDRFPIGRGAPWSDGGRLLVDATFDRWDRFARQVERRYRSGVLHAVSIRYEPRRWRIDETADVCVVTESVLLEVSAVVLPADGGAVKQPTPSRIRSFTDVAAGVLFGPGSPSTVGLPFRRRGGDPTVPSSPRGEVAAGVAWSVSPSTCVSPTSSATDEPLRTPDSAIARASLRTSPPAPSSRAGSATTPNCWGGAS